MAKHTDLAMEARELWQHSAGRTTKLPGVRAGHRQRKGLTLTKVEVLDTVGAQALGKPVGKYVTLEWEKHLLREPDGFSRTAQSLGRQLRRMLPGKGEVLVVGLGNAAVTPDAVGPRAMEHLMVTRHLGKSFPQLRAVSAIAPGVLGTTGVESVQIVGAIVEKVKPTCVVVVDALASRSHKRVCAAVQLTDTGITPGSGVGNHRMAFDHSTLGVPVVAVGVPTVIEPDALLENIFEDNDINIGKIRTNVDKSMIVTPRDIDAKIHLLARLLGYGISLGLHDNLTVSDVSCFVG